VLNRQRAQQRMEGYNENPTRCLQCDTAILIPLEEMTRSKFQQVKRKKFCNQSCGAKYNMARTTFPRNKPKPRNCTSCGTLFFKVNRHRSTTRCPECNYIPMSLLPLRTKKACPLERIREHARGVLFKVRARMCQVCGYTFHVDCCHIKPIRAFPSTALVGEINDPCNLIALCKNHHDELDKGVILL